MPVPVSSITRAFALAIMAAALLLVSPAHAEVGEKPETPETGAYVNEIDTDWVVISANTGLLQARAASDLSSKFLKFSEIWDLAEFACRLYNRRSVLLSQSYEGNEHVVTRIDYFFACGIE